MTAKSTRTRSASNKSNDSARKKTTISPAMIARLESIDYATRRLEKLLSEQLTRGEMSDLLSNRSNDTLVEIARNHKVTVADIERYLDLVMVQRQV